MHEPDARVELRKTSDPFFNSRHAYEHHAGRALVEDGSHLFEAVHPKAIRLIHQDQSGVAEMAAGIAQFNKSAVFDGFYKRLTTRCGTFYAGCGYRWDGGVCMDRAVDPPRAERLVQRFGL
jgi:hypothetical protein